MLITLFQYFWLYLYDRVTRMELPCQMVSIFVRLQKAKLLFRKVDTPLSLWGERTHLNGVIKTGLKFHLGFKEREVTAQSENCSLQIKLSSETSSVSYFFLPSKEERPKYSSPYATHADYQESNTEPQMMTDLLGFWGLQSKRPSYPPDRHGILKS